MEITRLLEVYTIREREREREKESKTKTWRIQMGWGKLGQRKNYQDISPGVFSYFMKTHIIIFSWIQFIIYILIIIFIHNMFMNYQKSIKSYKFLSMNHEYVIRDFSTPITLQPCILQKRCLWKKEVAAGSLSFMYWWKDVYLFVKSSILLLICDDTLEILGK